MDPSQELAACAHNGLDARRALHFAETPIGNCYFFGVGHYRPVPGTDCGRQVLGDGSLEPSEGWQDLKRGSEIVADLCPMEAEGRRQEVLPFYEDWAAPLQSQS